MDIPLELLDIDPDYNGRTTPRPEVVKRYRDAIDFLPPITVYPYQAEGITRYKVLDGGQRVGAFTQENRATIPATIFQGTDVEARSFGMTANLKSPQPYTPEERDRAVLQYLTLHPRISPRNAAAALSLAHTTILRIQRAEELAQDLAPRVQALVEQGFPVHMPPRATLHEIAMAPEAHRLGIAKNVLVKHWGRTEIRSAIAQLASGLDPEEVLALSRRTPAVTFREVQILLDKLATYRPPELASEEFYQDLDAQRQRLLGIAALWQQHLTPASRLDRELAAASLA